MAISDSSARHAFVYSESVQNTTRSIAMKRIIFLYSVISYLCAGSTAHAQTPIPTTNALPETALSELWIQDALLQTNVSLLYGTDGSYRGKLGSDEGYVRTYDSGGAYRGQAKRTGNDWSFYDQHDRYLGKASRRRDTTMFYEQGGSYKGKAIKKSDATYYYDTDGKYLGKTVRDMRGNFRFYGDKGKRAGDLNQ